MNHTWFNICKGASYINSGRTLPKNYGMRYGLFSNFLKFKRAIDLKHDQFGYMFIYLFHCFSVSMWVFQLKNCLMDFNEIWYEHYATGAHKLVFSHVLILVIITQLTFKLVSWKQQQLNFQNAVIIIQLMAPMWVWPLLCFQITQSETALPKNITLV
jgi:hypothetical protein